MDVLAVMMANVRSFSVLFAAECVKRHGQVQSSIALHAMGKGIMSTRPPTFSRGDPEDFSTTELSLVD